MRFWLSLIFCAFISTAYGESTDPAPISFDDYKALVRYIQKENKYEGLIHVVPTAREKFEKMVEERPDSYKAYGSIVQAALRQALHELDGAPIPEAVRLDDETIKKNPNFKQHKELIKHVLEELNIERKLKHKNAYPEQSMHTLEAELAHLKSTRPKVPLEVELLEESSESQAASNQGESPLEDHHQQEKLQKLSHTDIVAQ